MNTNNTFQKAAKRVGYVSSVVLLGTIGSLVLYASFAAFTGPVSGPSAANHSKGFLYDYMFGAATTTGAVQQGVNWTDVPSSGTAALAGTLNEKLNFVVNKLFTGISTAALDGVYDSTLVAANKNGNALNMLKYIQQGIDSAGAASGGAGGYSVQPTNASSTNYIIFKPTNITYPATTLGNIATADALCMDPANKPDEAVSTGFVLAHAYDPSFSTGRQNLFRSFFQDVSINMNMYQTYLNSRIYPTNSQFIIYHRTQGAWQYSTAFSHWYNCGKYLQASSSVYGGITKSNNDYKEVVPYYVTDWNLFNQAYFADQTAKNFGCDSLSANSESNMLLSFSNNFVCDRFIVHSNPRNSTSNYNAYAVTQLDRKLPTCLNNNGYCDISRNKYFNTNWGLRELKINNRDDALALSFSDTNDSSMNCATLQSLMCVYFK